MASPPFRSTRAMQASIDSLDTSLHATLAPYLASASATPLPMFGPTPVTSATLPSRDTSTVTRSLSPELVRALLIMWRRRRQNIGPMDRRCRHRLGHLPTGGAAEWVMTP